MPVPFKTPDLLNWITKRGIYLLLDTTMLTHQPDWGDMQAVLNTFAEERRKAKEAAERNRQNPSQYLHLREDQNRIPILVQEKLN